MKHLRRMMALAIASAAISGPAAATECVNPPAPPLGERIHGAALIWKEADYNFAFFDQVPELDWDAQFQRTLDDVADDTTMVDYYRSLQRMVATLKDGHSGVYWPDTIKAGCLYDTPQLQVASFQGRVMVINAAAGLAEQIPLGSEILAVDGTPVQEKLVEDVYPYLATSADHVRLHLAVRGWPSQRLGLLTGPAGSVAKLKIADPSGQVRTIEILRDQSRIEQVDWERATPQPPANGSLRWDGRIAILTITSFNDDQLADKLEPKWAEIRAAEGLVVDIADNGGGKTSNAYPLIDRIASSTAKGATWRSRKNVAAFRAWAPHVTEYAPYATGEAWHLGDMGVRDPLPTSQRLDLPVAIVTSWRTGSAAEDFAIFLDGQPNVRRVGEATFGSTGQPLRLELPGGGQARIVSKRDTFPDGRDFVGYGVQPHITISATIQDVLANRRPDLEAAIHDVRQRAVK